MASIKVLLLISAISSSHSEMLSLYYMYSVISKSLMSGEMSEFYTSVELDDIQMSLCHSVNKADFMTQLCEESERLFSESDDLHYKQQWLQINLKTLMRMMEHKRKNSTRDTDLHVLQWIHGCAVERHSNGSVMFLQGTDEYAYDGQTLTFDLSMHWKPLVLDHDIIWDRESVSSLERKCAEMLTSFIELQLERKFIMESRPDVHTLVKASGSSVKQLLVCLATGFYPKHVEMEIRHNQTPLPDEQLNSDGIRPNADGSFQLMKSLEILPSERSQYQCVVKHQSLSEPQIIIRDEGNVLLLLLIGFIVALVVFAIILLVFYLLRKCVKRRKYTLNHQKVQLLQSPTLVLHNPDNSHIVNPTPTDYDNIVKWCNDTGEDDTFSFLVGSGDDESVDLPGDYATVLPEFVERDSLNYINNLESTSEEDSGSSVSDCGGCRTGYEQQGSRKCALKFRGFEFPRYRKGPERCAGLAAALNDDSDDENPTDLNMEEEHTEEVHDTQSLCDTEATPAAARGAMGSKIISLPNFAMEREDTDQNVTQNALLLPLPRRCRSKIISLPNLTQDRKDSDDSS
ncbi:hereditary hemochromatosis protein homolog isoform X2 [Megalobrama amblycephala]|uniref:hereditary hemochromatosis protein homolog isoform X2 n=1 Tax=Megalobrama amblycephala TaxID=75352 RepID=UPI0020144774|nr:hereditary hemochromatosis protein homolog isoform X2 [Megalobrama amblycephala]